MRILFLLLVTACTTSQYPLLTAKSAEPKVPNPTPDFVWSDEVGSWLPPHTPQVLVTSTNDVLRARRIFGKNLSLKVLFTDLCNIKSIKDLKLNLSLEVIPGHSIPEPLSRESMECLHVISPKYLSIPTLYDFVLPKSTNYLSLETNKLSNRNLLQLRELRMSGDETQRTDFCLANQLTTVEFFGVTRLNEVAMDCFNRLPKLNLIILNVSIKSPMPILATNKKTVIRKFGDREDIAALLPTLPKGTFLEYRLFDPNRKKLEALLSLPSLRTLSVNCTDPKNKDVLNGVRISEGLQTIHLSLQSCHISSATAKQLSKLTQLESLSLHRPTFDKEATAFLKNLSKLSSITLDAGTTDNVVQDIADLTTVSHLSMSYATDTQFSILRKMTSLESLDLNQSHLTNLDALDSMTLLRKLTLSFGKITLTSDAIKHLSRIEELHINGVKANPTFLERLSQLPNLRRLKVDSSQIVPTTQRSNIHLTLGYKHW